MSLGLSVLLALALFGPDDSGRRICGRTFTSRRTLPAFRVGGDGVWRAPVPAGTRFDQLWVNGRLAVRAREPNDGYLYLRAHARPNLEAFVAEDSAPFRRLATRPPDEQTNVLVRLYHSWDTEPIHLKAFDAATGWFRLDGRAYYDPFGWGAFRPRFTLENARAFLDAPGEWFLDRAAGELLYVPRPGETPETAVAAFAQDEALVKIEGVRDLVFENCTFEFAGHLFARRFHPHQAASNLGAAVEANRCTNLVFRNCRFRNVTRHALWLNESCRDCMIEGCVFEDLGAGAVRVGPRRWDAVRSNEAVNVTLADSVCRRGGRVFPESVGVLFTHVVRSRIVRNEVADWLYTGISLGWNWGYVRSCTRDNLIADNHVWNIGQGVLSDVGCIYHLGIDPGTSISGNLCHDVKNYPYGGWGANGIYLDEGTSHVSVRSNRLARCQSHGITLHYGRENLVQGNVMTPPLERGQAAIATVRPEAHVQLVSVDNAIVPADDARFADLPPPPVWPEPMRPAPFARPAAYADDFEDWSPDEAFAGSLVARGDVRLTDAVARSGRQSIRFTDGDPKAVDYLPHLFSSFRAATNGFACSFSIRFDARASLAFLLRDYRLAQPSGHGFAEGPSFAVRNGRLVSGGGVAGERDLGAAVADEWYDVTLRLAPRGEAPPSFSLRVVRVSTGEAVDAQGEARAPFRTCDWIGFVSPATWKTVFDVDDLRYGPLDAAESDEKGESR